MEIKPVKPFEPISTLTIPKGNQWIGQIKWDGVRILTYYDGDEVKLFNRKLHERTMQFPELIPIQTFCNAQSVILDGEVIALDHGMPSFQLVMRRDSMRIQANVDFVKARIPIVYMVFDLLFLNGEWMLDKTLQERQQILEEIIRPNDWVQLVQSFTDSEALFEAVKLQGLEGVVCKDIHSTYALEGKDKRWQKRKNFKEIIAVIGGVTLRASKVNALLLGQYNARNQLVYIGHAGTGKLTQQDWRDLTMTILSLRVAEKPFSNEPVQRLETWWLQPILTVKIQFMEWTSNLTLRLPSIQAFVNVSPQDCLLEENH